jgi:SAM-dependent methyltransferase
MTPEVPALFDRELYLARQARARRQGETVLSRYVAADLAERLAGLTPRFPRLALISSSPELYLPALTATGKADHITALAPAPSEHLDLPAHGFEAIISILDLHAVNDVAGQLIQMHRALVPNGLLVAVLFAGDTLKELREAWLAAEMDRPRGASPRVAPMTDARTLGGLLQRAGLALPVVDMDRRTVRYPDPLSLMQEIRGLGLSNPLHGRSRSMMTQNLLLDVARRYTAAASDSDGRIRASVELAWATAWSPHDSQQKPLKPGSASMRLEEALRLAREKPGEP